MFKCEGCKKTTKPREQMTRVPVEFHDVRQPLGQTGMVVTKEIKRESPRCPRCMEARDRRALSESADKVFDEFGAVRLTPAFGDLGPAYGDLGFALEDGLDLAEDGLAPAF